MFKLVTLVAFLSAQISSPLHAYAGFVDNPTTQEAPQENSTPNEESFDSQNAVQEAKETVTGNEENGDQQRAAGPVVTEFENSTREIEQKVAKLEEQKEKDAQAKQLKAEIRDRVIRLNARVNQLETLANEIPNVREDVIEESAQTILASEERKDNGKLFGISAVVAVASGIVYALTKYDVPKAIVGAKATHKSAASAQTTAKPQNLRVPSTVVNNSLRSVYGNQMVARTSATVGVLAALVAGYAVVDSYNWSSDDRAAIKSLENNYLSLLVSNGQAEHLTNDEIEDALERYHEDPELREAVLEEVRTIVSETDALISEINEKKQELKSL